MFATRINSIAFPKSTLQCSWARLQFLSTNHAHHLFDKSPQRTNPIVNSSMLSYIHQNLSFKALNAFRTELEHNFPHGINEDSVAIALKACRGDPKPGMALHSFAVASGFVLYRPVLNSLMSMYCKAGQLWEALGIFNGIDEPDIVSYNTILLGFESGEDALKFACGMHEKGVVFDPVSYTTALTYCLDGKGFLFGSQLHCGVVKSGLDSEVFVGNALITLYSRWGRIGEAERVFDEMPWKDSVSWSAMLCGYSQEGRYSLEALRTFPEMVRQGMKPDHVSLTAAISACGYEKKLEMGRSVHAFSIKVGCGRHGSVCNLLMSMYAKCGVNEDVSLVFRDMEERNVVSWTTMISVFEEDALSLFHEMRMDGVYPNDITFVGLLHAIALGNLVREGQMVHGFCIKSGFVSELNAANSLISMYAKFGSMGDSVKVFQELQHNSRDIVSWNALISGYDQHNLYQEVLEAFYSARTETQPNAYTFGSVLSALGSAEAISLRYGQNCHAQLLKLGLNHNPIVSGALVDMYAKRGSLFESKRVFEETPERTQFAWTSLVSAHARHGDYESVMQIFEDMRNEHVDPDSVTFLSMLTACARKGMVDRGREIWDSMIKDNHIKPSREHYASMVDMLGRAGRLREAEELLPEIPGGPSFSALQSLLGACRTHGDVDMGRRIADRIIEMEPEESGSYVLWSNLCAEKGDWEKVATIRRKMRDRRVKKEVGFSWVDVGGSNGDGSLIMHGFSSDDKSHPRNEEIFQMASCLGLEMKFLERERLKKSLVDVN